MADPVFPIFASLAIVLCLIPSPWHYKARNSGTLIYIFWIVLGNLVFMVNHIVWAGNLRNPVPVWCDITSKIVMGLGAALPTASLCINRRLYHIATVRIVNISKAHKRREMIIDLLIGFGIPIIYMVLHYVVQGHRYDIIEDIGCWPATYNTPLAVVLILIPPIVLSLVSVVYCILSIVAFMKHRSSFNSAIASHNSNPSRYFRLMALASMEILFSLPLSIYHLVQNLRVSPLHPWISWEDTHFGFERVDFVPLAFFRFSPVLWIDINISRWLTPFGGFVFFIFFGLAPEARERYKEVYYAVVKHFGVTRPLPTDSFATSAASNPRFQISSGPVSVFSRTETHTDSKFQKDLNHDSLTDSESVEGRLSNDIDVILPTHPSP